MNMSRFVLYFWIVVALAFGALIGTFSSSTSVPYTPAVTPTASSSLPLADTAATTSKPVPVVPVQKKVVSPALKPVPIPVTAAPAPQKTVPVAPSPSESELLDVSATTLRNALVNIICYAPAGGVLHSISGSGVIVDPKGIILTNAHIAQYFLLADRDVSCIIRAGSPAADRYKAELIYISPAWLRANASVLTQSMPNGTGEYDFALLAVTKSATAAALPTVFPSIPLAQTPPSPGTSVVIASYGAQFLESSQVQFSLFPTIVFGSVKDVFTFVMNTIDVLALGGSVAAQEGSSGGGVADASGTLVGTITTSTTQGATETRRLDAITASYIRAEYASEIGEAIDLLLARPTATAITNFAPRIPELESIITAQLH